jgi:diphosphomevalonate decarboxylase
MSRSHHLVRAPSNIALIKYMGKREGGGNLPENPSLSMTLDRLATWVAVRRAPRGSGIALEAGVPEGAPDDARAPSLSAAGRDKALRHAAFARTEAERILPARGLACDPSPDLALRTANTFPEASGIASSASSFAAVTLAVALSCARDPAAFERAWSGDVELRRELARVSRRGSGSSCRSFEGPWVRWQDESALPFPASRDLPPLAHFVLLISSEAKGVSSSEAHARVKGSPLWIGRAARAARRLGDLESALSAADFASLARVAWSEAWEMHSLFHTAEEPFTYWKPGSIDALEWLAPFVRQGSVIATMDAGPNVHVTVRAADAAAWRARFAERFGAHAILEDRPGQGASIARLGAVGGEGAS